uniref:Reverse transcriptase n=1 Tax=Tanacetum cinerariifolium TaxID=118510 RepID=A0A6L2J7F9_TANCI|nr:reverse transcriptase [Tanacetum cinerariifolium]
MRKVLSGKPRTSLSERDVTKWYQSQFDPVRPSTQMVNTRQSTLEFLGLAFDEAVQQAVNTLLPVLTVQITNELRQNGAGGNVDAENMIAHIEKLFKVLGCADEFKVGLASYKFEGPLEKQAKHFKWALCDWILDGIVNTEFTNVAQVANVERNIELLHERRSDGHGYDRQNNSKRDFGKRGNDGRSYDRGYTDSASSPPCDTCGKLHPGRACHRITGACFSYGLTGHIAKDCPKNGGSGRKGNGNDKQLAAKGKAFSLTRDLAANSSGTVSRTLLMNDRVVFILFDTGATHSVISITLAKYINIPPMLLNFTLSISTPMKGLAVINHEYQNCPLRFDDKIRSANLFSLDMHDFDIIMGMD